jgi:phosphoribosylamine-glycine ligase
MYMKSLIALQIRKAWKQNLLVQVNVETFEYRFTHNPEALRSQLVVRSNNSLEIKFSSLKPTKIGITI